MREQLLRDVPDLFQSLSRERPLCYREEGICCYSIATLQWHFLSRAYSQESSPIVPDFVLISSRCDMLQAFQRLVQTIHQKRETHEVPLS